MSLAYTQFFVNHTTRMCQALGGHPDNPEHQKNVADAIKAGFVEVTGDEQDAFRAETRVALDAGWNPSGRTSYAKFIENQVKP